MYIALLLIDFITASQHISSTLKDKYRAMHICMISWPWLWLRFWIFLRFQQFACLAFAIAVKFVSNTPGYTCNQASMIHD